MKKILIVTFLLTTTITQAHAISEAYRRQLQKEHKTQLSDIAAPQNVEAYKPGKLKPIHVNKNGIDFKRSADGFAYLDGVLMAKDEDNSDATAYSSGLYTVIV
uniref:hypothetical protein n=1 Tax=Enterobacter sp. 296B2 TaxID=3077765 RepID=UPI002A7F47A7